MAYQLVNGIRFGLGWDQQETVERIEYHAALAKEHDPLEAMAYFGQGRALAAKKDYDAAVNQTQTGLGLNPNLSRGQQNMGWMYGMCLSRLEAAIPYYEAALRVSPRDPHRGVVLMQMGSVLTGLKRFDLALEFSRRAVQFVPKFFFPRLNIAICLAKLNRWSEAKAELQVAIGLQPSLSLKTLVENASFVGGTRINEKLETLQQLGLREE